MFNRESVSSVLGLVMAAGLALFAIVIVLAMYVGGATSSVIYTAVFLGFIVSFVVGFGFANKVITGRLREALRSVTAISNGNYNFEMEDLGADEIGQIAVKLGETQRKYRRIFEDLTGFIDTAIKTSHQLSQAKSRADQGVRRQEMDTERLQAAVSELSGSVEEVATHASTAAQSAQEADTEADNGKSVVNFTRESISALAKHVQVAADVINKLEEHSNSIGTILDVIRGIAEQTNLLALNAAIEAARAGEQGRGFAVVADEVRTLAQRTQESTQEIQSMIEKLQAGSKEAVEAMNRGREGAENCLDQATKAGLALEQITNAVGKINEMNMQIAAAAKEQSKATDAITENVSNIRETTHSTVEVNNLTAVASDELEALAANLKKFMQQNRM